MQSSQRHRLVVGSLLLVSLLLLIGSVLFTPPSTQLYAQSAEETPNSIVQSYANDMGISYEEAKRRLELQNEFSLLEQKVIEGEPSYAGSWTMHQPEFGLVIAFAAPDGKTILQKYLEGIAWAELVHVQQSPYTVAELQAIAQTVLQAARETGIPFGGGSNPKTSKVTIYTPQPEEMRQRLESNLSIQEYWNDIEYVNDAGMAVPAIGTDDATQDFILHLPLVQRQAENISTETNTHESLHKNSDSTLCTLDFCIHFVWLYAAWNHRWSTSLYPNHST
ncbi:MAG: hypothetical protein U0175_02510 [Caldilineaceae bacterium]